MTKDEFKKYIESIGFISNTRNGYRYKNFVIVLWTDIYYLNNGSKWIYDIPYTDLSPISKSIRSIKLKSILE